MGNTSDSLMSACVECSSAQGSGAAVGPGAMSVRNDDERAHGSGEAVNLVMRVTRAESTGEVMVDSHSGQSQWTVSGDL